MKTRISLSLLSLSIVSYELLLMHFFSMVQWQHFASMVISIALLGFGASGTLLSLFRRAFLNHSVVVIPVLMITTGLLMACSFPLSRSGALLFDSYTLFMEHEQIGKLLGNYLLFFLPFFTGALAIGLIFIEKAAQIGRFYFADLMGAGLGGLLALALLWKTDFHASSLLVGAIPLVAGLLSVDGLRSGSSRLLWLYGLGGISVLLLLRSHPADLTPSPFKSISYALNLPDARVEFESQSPHGLLQVVSSPVQRYAPGLSLNFRKEVPSLPIAFNNGNWAAAIPEVSVNKFGDRTHGTSEVLDFTTMGVAYRAKPVRTALQLYAGAGFEVRQALDQGVEHVDAVEPNAPLLNLIRDHYADRTDSLYFDPRVSWSTKSPRSFLQQTHRSYDLIQLPLLGAFGGSVGLNALDEEWILTRQGLAVLWDKLEQDGLLAVSCWIDVPQKVSTRIASLIADLLDNKGIRNPGDHLIMIRSWGTLSFLVVKAPVSKEKRQRICEFCEDLQFDLIPLDEKAYDSSGNKGSGLNDPFNLIQDENYENNLKSLFLPERGGLIQTYPFNIEVPTDDKPYFFQFLKLTRWAEQRELWGASSTTFQELGYFLALLTFGQLLIFALLFILLPLVRLGWKGQDRTRTVTYFAALGLGYMFVEIVLIKLFQIYLGHPLYSIATVISVMLISSGLGSRFSEHYGMNPAFLRKVLLFIALLIFGYSIALGNILSTSVGAPQFVRVVLSVILIAIPAFAMGMPFPLGLKMLDAKDKGQVPWAWGINGCVSVISTTLAAIVALELGFTSVLLLAGLAYALALVSVKKA